MQKIYMSFSLLLVLGMVFASANETILKMEHEQWLDHFGDIDFYKATQDFVDFGGDATSIYSLGEQKSIYCRFDDAEEQYAIYRVVADSSNDTTMSCDFTDRIIVGSQTYTLKYNLSWPRELEGRENSCQVKIDEASSDFLNTRVSKVKVLTCLAKHGKDLFSVIKGCLAKPKNLKGCILKFVGPGAKLYLCIFGAQLAEATPLEFSALAGPTTIRKVFGVSKSNTRIYIDFEHPILAVESIRTISGLGGVAFHERSAGAPSVIYFAGIAYPQRPGLVEVKVLADPTKLPKKNIVVMTKHGSFSVGKTNDFVDFGAPVIHIRALSVTSGFGAVISRQVIGNGVRLTGAVYNKPGHFSFRVEVAVYK